MVTEADIESALWSLRAYDTTALATVSDAGPHVGGVFFVPESTGGGIRLVIAQLRNSRRSVRWRSIRGLRSSVHREVRRVGSRARAMRRSSPMGACMQI